MTKKVHRAITPAERDAQQVDGRYIAPGVWIDRHGYPHFALPEILAHFGLENTPANEAEVEELIGQMARELGVRALVRQHVTTESPSVEGPLQ